MVLLGMRNQKDIIAIARQDLRNNLGGENALAILISYLVIRREDLKQPIKTQLYLKKAWQSIRNLWLL
jgi:hypothetical protein